MTALSDAQKIGLGRLAENLNITPQQQASATVVANGLRTEFPDIDDVTIGRILMSVSTLAAQCSGLGVNLGGFAVALAHSSLDLTAVEWQEAKL